MAWSFPRLRRSSVFIAAPGDMARLRRATVRALADLKSRSADDHGLAVFDWVIDMAADGFMDWIPAQGQIPLPSDELCRAVVCLFGERIGTPLPADFDLTPVGDLVATTSEPQVVHPWNPEAAASGGFSLTGTVFEFLAALHANTLRADMAEAERGSPPVLLLFVGGEELNGDLEPIDMGWGGYRLDAEARARFESSHPKTWRTLYSKWQREEYIPQLVQLRNFLRFVRSRGIVPRIVRDDQEALEAIRKFLRRSLRLDVEGPQREPFLGLEAFDVEDQVVFFGRKEERNQMLVALAELWDDPNRPAFFGILGGSGVGKSSMLRAGLVSSLCDPLSPEPCQACIVRPSEISLQGSPTASGAESRPIPDALKELVSCILTSTGRGESIEASRQRLAATRSEHQASTALEIVIEHLTPGRRLIIAFDQFEELIDQLSNLDFASRWEPVIHLIRLAAREPRIGILYTLQENRQEALDRHPVLGELFRTGGARFLSFPTQGLDEIIAEPFRAKGLLLEPALANEIRRRILAFAAFQDATVQGSLLPLVSAMLKRLYLRWGRALLDRTNSHLATLRGARTTPLGESMGSPVPGEPDSLPVLLLAHCQGALEVGDAIAELADEALEDAKSVAGPAWSEGALGALLRSLVRRHGRDDRLSLPAAPMPAKTAGRRLAESFLERRLLLATEDGRIRLVHEALLRHWPPAASWLEKERGLLEDSAWLGLHADAWDRGGRSVERLRPDDVDRAAMLLDKWDTNLSPGKGSPVNPEDARLRDYGVALLAAHADPRRKVGATTCLHVAAACGEASLVRQYLDLDPEAVDLVRKDGRTPLFGSCFVGAEDVVALLLASGADPNAIDNSGWRPLHLAVSGGALEVVAALLRAGAAIDSRGPLGTAPLEIGAREGSREILTLLLENGADPGSISKRGWTPLHTAVDRNRLDAARVLLDHGADIQAQSDLPPGKGPSPLHLAAQTNSAEMAKLLIDRGANLEALWVDRAARDVRVSREVRKVLEEKRSVAGANIERDSATPLQVAVQWSSAEVAWQLLEAGADPNSQGSVWGTPLHASVQLGNMPLIAMLLGHGADPEIPRTDGVTPLHLARFNSDDDVLALMLSYVQAKRGGDGVEAASSAPSLARERSLPGYDWVAFEGEGLAGLVAQLHPIDGQWPLDEHRTRIALAVLPWYRDVALIEIADPSWGRPNLKIYYLAHNENLFRLNGVSAPIFEVNRRAKLVLPAKHALGYLRHFCFFVRGEGPYCILESAEDPLLPPYLDPTTRQLLEGIVRPAAIEERKDEGRYLCHATTCYTNALFHTTFDIRIDGMVYLNEFQAVASNLPFRIQAPIV